MDFLPLGILHLASSEVLPEPNPRSPIYQSPMLATENSPAGRVANQSRLPGVSQLSGTAFKTPETVVEVQTEQKGVSISNANGERMVDIRASDLKKDWKTIEISTDAVAVYGLGEFPRGSKTDEPWLGWIARTEGEHGNIMSPFFGGVQTYTQYPVAFGVRENGTAFGIFIDTPYKIDWDFRNRNTWRVHTWGDELRYFVFTGRNLREVHQKYISLVGRSPLPPKSVFGTGISKFGYHNWSEVDRDIHEMEKHGMPVGLVGLDLFWFGGDFIHNPHPGTRHFTKMGTLTPDPQNFPDFSNKVRSLKAKGVEVMLISESYVNLNLPEAQKLLDWGCVVKDPQGHPIIFENKWWGTGYMIDWTHPKSAEWIKLKYIPLAEAGVRNFWFDLGEPEAGLYAPHGRYHGIETNKNQHGDIHNIYNLMWIKRFHEVMDQRFPGDRFFIMNRSGSSGMQRYGAGKWGGDTGVSVITDGPHPKLERGDIPELIAHLQNRIKSMPLVGVDYYTSDVGGFHRWALRGDSRLRDLTYTLWYANSALLDLPFRPHLWVKDGESRYLPTETGHVPSNIFASRQRSELEPYYFQAAFKNSSGGTPIIAPLFYYHPTDPNVREMGHQAYIGRDLMMAIVGNIYETQRNVYLPAGGWYDFHSNQFHREQGSEGRWLINVQVKRGESVRLPIFAREGSIVPLDRLDVNGLKVGSSNTRINGGAPSGEQSASAQPELRLRIFASANKATESWIIEDTGIGKNHRQAELPRTKVRQEKTSRGYTVTVSPTVEKLPIPRNYRIELVVPENVLATNGGAQAPVALLNQAQVKFVSQPELLSSTEPTAFLDAAKNLIILNVPSSKSQKLVFEFDTK